MSAMASRLTSLTIVNSTVYSRRRSKKHQSSLSLAFVRGIHRWPVNSPHKGPATRKMFPFDDVIMSAPCKIRVILFRLQCVNTLWPNVAILHQRTWPTLAQVMAFCLTAPGHYPVTIITNYQWDSVALTWNQFHMSTRDISSQNCVWKFTFVKSLPYSQGPKRQHARAVCHTLWCFDSNFSSPKFAPYHNKPKMWVSLALRLLDIEVLLFLASEFFHHRIICALLIPTSSGPGLCKRPCVFLG